MDFDAGESGLDMLEVFRREFDVRPQVLLDFWGCASGDIDRLVGDWDDD
jgi:hypothetical protein